MQVARLTRRDGALLYRGRLMTLTPLCPLVNMAIPLFSKRNLDKAVRLEAEQLAKRLVTQSKPNTLPDTIFYDASHFEARSANESAKKMYALALQLYSGAWEPGT